MERFDGAEAAKGAEERFDQVHVRHDIPDDIPEVELGDGSAPWAGGDGQVHLPALIASAFGISSSEARRLLDQGGVKIDGEPLRGDRLDLPSSRSPARFCRRGRGASPSWFDACAWFFAAPFRSLSRIVVPCKYIVLTFGLSAAYTMHMHGKCR